MLPTEKPSLRIDWVHVETHVIDEESRQFGGTLIPDPERYDWITIDGTKYLHDKFDDWVISSEEISKMIDGMGPQPIYYSAPKISDIHAYVKKKNSSNKKICR